jgi:hypothetical protein
MMLCAASPTALSGDRIEPQPVGAPITGPYNPDFVIDGIALGGSVDPESATYRVYSCRPSEDSPGSPGASQTLEHNRASSDPTKRLTQKPGS